MLSRQSRLDSASLRRTTIRCAECLEPITRSTKEYGVPKGDTVFFGGGGWIRTTEVTDNRFTVCPLWPLGNSSVFGFFDEG